MSLLSRLNRTLGAAAKVEPSPPTNEAEEDAATTSAAPPATQGDPDALQRALARVGGALHRREAGREGARAARTEGPPLHRAFTEPPLAFADALPSARTLETPHGPVWSIRTDYPLTAVHGDIRLGSLASVSFADLAVATADPRLEGFDPRRAIFIDLETTGLEHGGGNVAFIVAAAWFEGDVFRVEQLILREHDDEYAMLALIWSWLHAHPYLVSFNGKSFDLSILQNRLVLHRFSSDDRAAVKLRPHLDLLHVSRAFFKGNWADTRLQTMEREALGFDRDDDMPGALAPSCFFTWLRHNNARPLQHIATHNRDDVVTMLALATVLASLATPGGAVVDQPRVAMNLARRLVRTGNPSAALAFLDPLLGSPAPDGLDWREVAELGLTAARRTGDLDAARPYAERLLADDPTHGGAMRLMKRVARQAG